MKHVLIVHAAALALDGIGLAGHFAGASQGMMFMLFVTLFVLYLFASRHPLPEENCGLTL